MSRGRGVTRELAAQRGCRRGERHHRPTGARRAVRAVADAAKRRFLGAVTSWRASARGTPRWPQRHVGTFFSGRRRSGASKSSPSTGPAIASRIASSPRSAVVPWSDLACPATTYEPVPQTASALDPGQHPEAVGPRAGPTVFHVGSLRSRSPPTPRPRGCGDARRRVGGARRARPPAASGIGPSDCVPDRLSAVLGRWGNRLQSSLALFGFRWVDLNVCATGQV